MLAEFWVQAVFCSTNTSLYAGCCGVPCVLNSNLVSAYGLLASGIQRHMGRPVHHIRPIMNLFCIGWFFFACKLATCFGGLKFLMRASKYSRLIALSTSQLTSSASSALCPFVLVDLFLMLYHVMQPLTYPSLSSENSFILEPESFLPSTRTVEIIVGPFFLVYTSI